MLTIEKINIENKEYEVIDPNLFFNGKENVLIEPIYPFSPNVLDKTEYVMLNSIQQGKSPFIKMAFNHPNSLLAYAIIDNNKNLLSHTLNNPYVNPNVNILTHDKASILGKPLDIAINSILTSSNIDNVFYLIKKGAKSDNYADLIKKLEIKATRSENDRLTFRLLTLSNLLKVMNGIYNAEYIEKTISLNQLILQGNGSQENNKIQAEKILQNLDKISEVSKQETIKGLIDNKKEKVFIKEMINEKMNLGSTLQESLNPAIETYSLLISEDSTLIDYPRKTTTVHSTRNVKGFEKVEKNLNEIQIENEFDLSKDLINFLIYQSLEDLNKIDRFKLDEEINYTADFKENLGNLNPVKVEDLKKEIDQIKGSNIYVNNMNLPQIEINENSLLFKYKEIKEIEETKERDEIKQNIEKDKEKSFLRKIFGM